MYNNILKGLAFVVALAMAGCSKQTTQNIDCDHEVMQSEIKKLILGIIDKQTQPFHSSMLLDELQQRYGQNIGLTPEALQKTNRSNNRPPSHPSLSSYSNELQRVSLSDIKQIYSPQDKRPPGLILPSWLTHTSNSVVKKPLYQCKAMANIQLTEENVQRILRRSKDVQARLKLSEHSVTIPVSYQSSEPFTSNKRHKTIQYSVELTDHSIASALVLALRIEPLTSPTKNSVQP